MLCEKFKINGADQQTAAEMHPAWDWYKFRMIRLAPGTTSGTITFKE
jgi:hypothetical protein